MFKTFTFVLLLGLAILSFTACAGSAPTAAPTSAPATIAPTTAPTTLPTSAPTAVPTTAPTNTPAASPTTEAPNAPAPTNTTTFGVSGGTLTPTDALTNLQDATNFRFQSQALVSKVFFQGKPVTVPGQDPNTVVLFSLKGETKAPDLHYTIDGFLASLMSIFTGLDPNVASLQITAVNGKTYLYGQVPNTPTAKWYTLTAEQTGSLNFSPAQVLAPFLNAAYKADDFTKSGSESLDNQSCDVYTGSRAAFETLFPALTQNADLVPDTVDLSTVDRYEFKLWLCNDGKLHQLRYNFDAHSKTKPDQKGSLSFVAHISDYDAALTIDEPKDAVPFVPLLTQETPSPAATSSTPGSATSDGDWEGTTSDGSDFSFTIESGKVTYATVGYDPSTIVTCADPSFSSYGTSVNDGAIADNHFSFQLENTNPDHPTKFSVTGELKSNSEAAGTLHIESTLTCGKGSKDFTWTAKNTSGGGAGATPIVEATIPLEQPTETATTEPTGGSTGSAQDVVQNFFAALNQQDLDTAVSFVDDNFIYNFGSLNGIGKDNFRSALKTSNITYTVSNIKSISDLVNFTVTTSDGKTYKSSNAILSDGKIQILTVQ